MNPPAARFGTRHPRIRHSRLFFLPGFAFTGARCPPPIAVTTSATRLAASRLRRMCWLLCLFGRDAAPDQNVGIEVGPIWPDHRPALGAHLCENRRILSDGLE